MPSVRYAPTNSFVNHISGVGFERVRFIIIDDDLNSAFCPANLAALFRDSDRMRHYQVLPQPEEEGSVGAESKNSIVASGALVRGNIYANIEQKGFYLQDSASTNKDGVGDEQEQTEQKRGNNFLANLHSCYHHTRVSNITKFVYWSHGPTYCYIPQSTLLFNELKDTYTTARFDWKQSPHASVFMCNNHGKVEKLVFGDVTVSSLELISLGEPIGNIATHDMASSFISLVPGSDRADQIFDTLMVKTAREIQRPQWDASLSSAALSSPQSDEGFLMMKPAFSNKKTRNNRHGLNDSSSGKQLVRTKASCHIASEFHNGLDNQPSWMFFCPENSYHRTLNRIPSKIPARIATKIGTKAANPLTRGPPKNKKQTEQKSIELVVFVSATCSPESKTIIASPTLRLGGSNKPKKFCERLPTLSHTHPIQKTHRVVNTGSLNIDVITGVPGSTLSVRLHDGGDAETPEEVKELVQLAEEISFQKQRIGTNLVTPNAKCDVDRDWMELPTDHRLADVDSAAEIEQVLGYCKKPLSYLEPHMSNAPNPNVHNSDPTYVFGDKIPAFSPSIHTVKFCLRAPKSTPINTSGFNDKKPAIYPRFPKFDLRGLPYTCVPASPASDPRQDALPTSPHTSSYATSISDDPVFGNCIIRRGFYPIYPSKETPKTEFENRIGGLQNWYKWPPVQVAREYLPRGMKETDWSWTNNGVSGEFIPGGIAW